MSRVRKLTEAQLRMLVSLRDHGSPFAFLYASSRTRIWDHGGATQTLDSLIRRGLIERQDGSEQPWRLTDAGRAALSN
jgi:DNA-binding MarR family transcriptional regulator